MNPAELGYHENTRPSSAVIRREAAEVALALSILDRHLARLRARRQVLADELARTLDRLEVREAAESPLELPGDHPRGAIDAPTYAIRVTDETTEGFTVSPDVPYGDRCMEPMRSDDVCWRTKGHSGKHRGSRSMLKRAAHKRERRSQGKS